MRAGYEMSYTHQMFVQQSLLPGEVTKILHIKDYVTANDYNKQMLI